jgi:hypothetical protein
VDVAGVQGDELGAAANPGENGHRVSNAGRISRGVKAPLMFARLRRRPRHFSELFVGGNEAAP